MSHFPILKKINDFKEGSYFPFPPLRPLILLCKLVFILICFFKKISLRKEKRMVFSLLLHLFLLFFPLLYNTQPFSLPGGGGTAKCP